MARLPSQLMFDDLIRSTYGQDPATSYLAQNPAYPDSPIAVERPLTELSKRGMFGTSDDSYGASLASAQRELDAGEITRAEYAGRRAGVVGSMVGDTFAAIMPEWIENLATTGIQKIAETDVGQEAIRTYQDLNYQYPRAMKSTGDVLQAAELLGAGRAASGAKNAMHMLAANAPNALRFGNDNFYTGPDAARKQLLEDGGLFALGSKATKPSELEDWRVGGQQLKSRLGAMRKGLGVAVSNTLDQLSTPSLLAEWRRGVSKKMKDVAKEGTQQHQWGQAAYLNFLGKQYGNESDIFKMLDDEFFTHKGVFNEKELQSSLGLADDEFGPIFRTIKENQPVDQNTIMVVRQPTGRESSGDLINEVMNMTSVGKGLPNIFPMKKPFTADEFLDAFEAGRRKTEMTTDERLAVKFAFIENPNLSKITDPEEFRQEFQKAFTKAKKSSALDVDGNKAVTYANAALKNKERASVKNNRELAQLLEDRIVKPDADGKSKITMLRNTDQKHLPEADRDIYLMDTYDSSAYELGGINVIYRIKPNGQVSAIVNDVNDIGIIPKIPDVTIKGKNVGKAARKATEKVLDLNAPLGQKLIAVTPKIEANFLTGRADVATGRGEASGGLKKVMEAVNTDVAPEAQDYAKAAANVATAGSLLTELDPFAPDEELMGTKPFEL